MIAIDTNLLVYAPRADSQFHAAADACIASLAEGAASWAIPWPCLHEFLAIVTHPRIYASSTPVAKALDQVDAWLESPTLRLLTEAEDHWRVLRGLVGRARVAGPGVHDASSPHCAGSMACASCGLPTATSAASRTSASSTR